MHELLCEHCEQYLNREFEQPFFDVWYVRGTVPTVVRGPVYNLSLPSYASFKLFLLSVLWRASVCQHGAFASTTLGQHERTVKAMLLSRDPGASGDYPVFGTVMRVPGTLAVPPVVISPFLGSWEGTPAYIIGFGGVLWMVLLRRGELNPDARGWALMEDGRMSMVVMEMSDLGAVHRSFTDYATLAAVKGWRNPWSR